MSEHEDDFSTADFDDYLAAATILGRGVHDIPLRDYLADPCPQPSLRSSDIDTMLRQRPAHVRALHPRLTDDPKYAIRKATRRMDLGTVVHELVLGKGAGFCVIDPAQFLTKKGLPSKSKNTDEYRAARAEATAKGLTVLDPAADAAAQRIAERIVKRLEVFLGKWPIADVTEQTLIWTETIDGAEVWCRTRPDIFVPELGLVVDLKTCGTGLGEDELQRTMSHDDGAFFIQTAWQQRGAVQLFPELAGRIDPLTHIFAETEPPYEPRPVDASAIALQEAKLRCLRAVERFAACLAADDWPAWARTSIQPATWLESKWLQQEESDAVASA
jgi:hypothetical protein